MPQTPPEVTVPGSAANQRERFTSAYAILEDAIGQRAFPGAAFGVLAGDEILAVDGVGGFTYDVDSPRVSASTIYDLASVTKVLATTSMAMLLYQRGKLEPDDCLVRWLPNFADGEEPEGPRHQVTIRMLLAHSSGLPGYARLFESSFDSQSLFEACLHQPLEAAPGTRAEYSDLGFILLGRVLETIAGEPIDEFCRREVFRPLRMSSTGYQPTAEWKGSIAPTQDDQTLRHRVLQGEVQDENCWVMGGISGHTGLFSNALDPLRYAESVLSSFTRRGDQQSRQIEGLFAKETVDLFTRRSELPPGTSRALGWDTPSAPSSSGRYFSRHSAGHLGYAGTSLWIDFDRQMAVVLLTNRTWPKRESQAIRSVRPVFHDAVVEAIRDKAIP